MNVCTNFTSPETRVHPEHFALAVLALTLLIFTELFSKSTQRILDEPAQKQNLK